MSTKAHFPADPWPQCTLKWFRIVVFLVMFVASRTQAQTIIHVPADAPSIQAGIDAAHDGDTVLVAPGIYNENIDFKGKAITVTSGATAFSAAISTVINGSKDGPVASFQTGESASAVLNGFTLQNGHASVASRARAGGVYVDGASPTISNNLINQNYGCGVLIVGHGSPRLEGNDIKHSLYPTDAENDVLCAASGSFGDSGTGVFVAVAGNPALVRNIIEDNATSPAILPNNPTGAGILVLAADSLTLDSNVIRNNHTYDSSAFAMQITTPVPVLTFVNNLIYGNSNSSPFNTTQVFITGAFGTALPSLIQTNNTIYGGGEELVFSFGPSILANNVFVNTYSGPGFNPFYSGLACADPEAQTSPIQFLNNDVFNSGPVQDGGCTLGPGNLAVDPAFRNVDQGDFREQPDSPLIAKGDPTAPLILASDLDLKARTVCGTIDIGAYELRPSPSITLTTSANPTPGGNTLVFTSSLSKNCNVPTGTITFLDGGVPLGTAVLDASGIATLSTEFLVVGQHNITASYPGDFNFEASTSSVLVQIITGDPTVTTLSVLPNPAAAFSAIALSSVVSSPYGTPTGSVVFTADGQVLATAALDATGRANATISSLGAGTYSIVASYTADTRFQPSSSITVREVVIGAATVSSLTAIPNPATFGQSVVFTIRVQNTVGSTSPKGSVQLLDGAVPLGSATIAGGAGSFTTSSLSIGTHVITSNFTGDGNFSPSAATTTEVIIGIGTSLSLTTIPNPSNTGQTVTLTATAMGVPPASLLDGLVTFRDGLTTLGVVGLNAGGVAVFTTSSLSVGDHPLQASLSAGPVFLGSMSPVVTQTVQPYDFTLSASSSTLSLPSGDWSTVTVTVTPVGGFNGSVTLGCNNLPAYSQCVVDGGDSVSLARGPQLVSLTVNTSGIYKYGDRASDARHMFGGSRGKVFAAVCLLPFFGLWGLGKRKLGLGGTLALVVAVSALMLFQGCSGKYPGHTTPGTYSIRITGASLDQTIKHSAPLLLTITK